MNERPPVPESLLSRASEVFGNEAKARRWCRREHPRLDGRSPAAASQSEAGRATVERLLGQIESGVYE